MLLKLVSCPGVGLSFVCVFWISVRKKVQLSIATEKNKINAPQPNPNEKVTEGAIESVRLNGVSVLSGFEFRENVRDFFSQGQSKLSVILY